MTPVCLGNHEFYAQCNHERARLLSLRSSTAWHFACGAVGQRCPIVSPTAGRRTFERMVPHIQPRKDAQKPASFGITDVME